MTSRPPRIAALLRSAVAARAVRLAAAAASLAAAGAQDDPAGDDALGVPTWKSRAGTSIEAALVSAEGDSVVLRTAEGREVTVARSQLDAESLALLEQELAKMAADAEAADEDPWLPALNEGDGKGYYAICEREKFSARVNTRGQIEVFFKDGDGKLTSDRFLGIRPSLGYSLRGEWQGRPIRSASAEKPPHRNPDELTITGNADHGAQYEFTYVFKDDSIEAWGAANDPRDIEFPTICQVVALLPKFRDLDYTLPEETIRKAVGDSSLTVKRDRGDDIVLNYVDRYDLGTVVRGKKGDEGTPELAIVRCVLFGPREVIIEPSSLKYGRFLFYTAGTRALFDGYTVYFRNNDAKSNSRQSRLIVEVD